MAFPKLKRVKETLLKVSMNFNNINKYALKQRKKGEIEIAKVSVGLAKKKQIKKI